MDNILTSIEEKINDVYEEFDGFDPDSLGNFLNKVNDIIDEHIMRSTLERSKTVCIVIEDDCETNGPQIEAVFASKEKAEAYVAKQRERWGHYYVREEDVIE